MGKYLKKFDNDSDRIEYEGGESYLEPYVSYVEGNNSVHYDKPKETRVVAKFNVTSTSEPTPIMYEYGTASDFFVDIEVDGIILPNVVAYYQFDTLGEHTVKYTLLDPTSIDDYAFYYCSGLTSVNIPNNVTSIGDNAFGYCSGLISITIPDSVTSIGDEAFFNCTSLTSVTIPNSVTSIGGYAFQNCSGLINIIVDSGNSVYDSRNNCNAIIETSTNTLIKGCKNTIIPNDVTSIGYVAFQNCSGLTSVAIPDSVTSISGNAFAYCSGLTEVTIGSGLTEIGYMIFESCDNLVTLTIHSNNQKYDSRNDCNAIIETSANTLVLGCKSTIIPNTITNIGPQAFSYVEITDIVIPDSVTTIESYAFENCNSLTGITIGSGVTSISGGYGFINNNLIKVTTNSLTFPMAEEIVFGDSITNIPNNKFYYSKLKKITIGKNVTNIGSNAFYYCNGLTNIISLATIAPTIANNTFQNVKTNGTLTVPIGSNGYNTWMGTGNYYLGLYNWTKVEQ